MSLRHSGFVGNDSTRSFVVVEIPGKTKDELYKSCVTYLNSIYQNPEAVLSLVENHSTIVNALTESLKDDLYQYRMYYNIDIQFKDGKFKYSPSITSLVKIFYDKETKIYISDTDSPNEVEVNCIWMSSNKNSSYFLLLDELNLIIEKWANTYLNNLTEGIKEDDW